MHTGTAVTTRKEGISTHRRRVGRTRNRNQSALCGLIYEYYIYKCRILKITAIEGAAASEKGGRF